MFDLLDRIGGHPRLPDSNGGYPKDGKPAFDQVDFFISPGESFGYSTHGYGVPEYVFQWVVEGSRVWQLVPPSLEVSERLSQMKFMNTENGDFVYLRAPVEVADEFPVFIAELAPGDLLYVPVDYIHVAYSRSDSVSLSYVVEASEENVRPLLRSLRDEL